MAELLIGEWGGYSKDRMAWGFLAVLSCLALLSCEKQAMPDADGNGLRGISDPFVKATTLLAAEGEAGAFLRLTPEECGIDFTNELTDSKLIYEQVSTQAGLGVGDYDGDGDLDVYLLGLNSKNKLYRNDGGFRFTDVTAGAGEGLDGGDLLGSCGVFADLTGDGHLDLYVGNRNGANQLFVGNGKGKFTEEAAARGADVSFATVSAAVFDYDNDGDLDIYVANYKDTIEYDDFFTLVPEAADSEKIVVPANLADRFYVDPGGKPRMLPHPDQLLVNDGTGHFEDKAEEAGLYSHGWSFQAQACDFNNDGLIDLYVTGDFETADRFFLNNGDGSFSDRTADMCRKTPLYGMGCDSGDINGDGLPDLFVGDMASQDYKKSKTQNGDVNRWRWEMLNMTPQPQMRNMLYINRGDGWMTELAQFSGVHASDWTWACRIADLDCDGIAELFVTNGMTRDAMDVDTELRMLAMHRRGASPTQIMNFALSQPMYRTQNVIFTAKEPLKYEMAKDNWGMVEEAMGCGVSLADFDGDGDLDIIVNNTNAEAGVWRNDVATGRRISLDLRQEGANTQAVGARVWAYCGEDIYMRDVIISRGFATGESSRLFFGLGSHEKIERLTIRWPDLSVQEYSNLPAGKHYTISKASSLPAWQPAVHETLFSQSAFDWEQTEQDTVDEEYAAEPLLPFLQSGLGTGAGVADFDGDGKLDVYFGGAAGQAGQLFTGDGAGGFSASAALAGLIGEEVEEMGVLAFDANGDGRMDLFLSSGGMESAAGSEAYQDRLFLNMEGGFVEKRLPERRVSTAAAAAADVDGDGDLDLLVCGHLVPQVYGAAAESVLYANDGAGNFSVATERLAPGLADAGQITEAQFADMNGDGMVDLVMALRWGSVELWLNEGGVLVRGAALTKRGWWQSLGLGDFDGDGDIDVLCGNTGLNTKYRPKEGKPVTMFAHDFDQNGSRDLIEVKHRRDGELLPERGRSCSGYAIGYVASRYPTWASFADATVGEIYGQGLEEAERFEADELASVICINEGGGVFRVEELPLTAQLAPVFGIGVGDFNMDGKLDAYLANNFYGTQPETGRWNAGYGVLALGDGAGGFSCLEPYVSGISMSTEGRGVVPADFNMDGMLDLVVSASNAAPQLALGVSSAGAGGSALGSSLLVKLSGKAPNTAAVGARLKLVLDDGVAMIREVQAGGGYLSSYAGPLHFGIPKGRTPASLSITWPGGAVSETTSFDSRTIEL
ncbi:VCBS repeat-containing protein, partial [bacterium]|nr:VCBS repeat-containing protein [bacterium]